MNGIKVNNVGYIPVPKVACTSVKTALFLYENNRKHDSKIDPGANVHQYYRGRYQDISDCEFRFIIVRDPIKRFLSAYNNRVAYWKDLSYVKIRGWQPELAEELDVFDPNIATFIDDFSNYYKVNAIKHHTEPILNILTEELQYFTNVYKIEEINILERDLEKYLGRKITLPWLQTEGANITLEDLSRKQINFLADFYSKDYQLLKDFYSVDAIWDEWKDKVYKKRKSVPFIIWTFRRTGGTNLADALFSSSVFTGVEHEPFNAKRKFGMVTEEWRKNGNIKSLNKAINEILIDRPLIKHCLEIMPYELNMALAKLSIKYGYKHLFLYRENAINRLLSLNYSQKTNVWSKEQLLKNPVDNKVFRKSIPIEKLLTHEKQSREKMLMIYQLLKARGEKPLIVSFEKLYENDFATAANIIKEVFAELLGSDELCTDEFLTKTLKGGRQDSNQDYKRFPNSQKFVNKIGELPLFSLDSQPAPSELKDNPLVTVVIPVYNVSKYINRCLDSVINQTYENLEILVVDDKGQDDSIDKVNEYLDSRITIIAHQENKGLPSARNTGINNANGEFILFLDSDDYISHDLIEKCLKRQQVNDVDCVVFNTNFFDDSGRTFVNEWMDKFTGYYIENKCIDDECTHRLVGWDVAAWSKLIRLDYLKKNNIYFQESQLYYEDHHFSAQLYMSKICFSYIDERLHYYYKRGEMVNKSITQTQNPLMTHYRSKMLKNVCLLIESIDNNYKNIFYPAFISFYKIMFSEAFSSKKYQKEIYENLSRTFAGIGELDLVDKLDLADLDLAFLVSHYSYEEFVNKFESIWSFTAKDVKKVIPVKLHSSLKDYKLIRPPLIKYNLQLAVSAGILLAACILKKQPLGYYAFQLRLRDYHIIRRRGVVNYPSERKGFKKYLKIFDYITRGEKEGDRINDRFDSKKYLEMNPDLSFMNMGLYAHFLFYSEFQKRNVAGLK